MKSVLAQKWVEALRSGRRKQATGRLRRKDPATNKIRGYCCLGVLCDVAKNLPEFAPYKRSLNSALRRGYDLSSPIDPDKAGSKTFLSLFGLTRKTQKALIIMNDSQLKPFTDIAKEVERRYL